jgi:hypothetical protein
MRLADDAIVVKLGERNFGQTLNEELKELPEGTGGWLPAMHYLRQMMTRQAEGFSDLYYVGSEPLDGTGPRVDVLEGLRGESTCRWYFDQKSKQCVGMDYRRVDDVDDCEMRFGGLQAFGTYKFPSTIEVRHAGQAVGTLKVEAIQVGAGAKTAAKN